MPHWRRGFFLLPIRRIRNDFRAVVCSVYWYLRMLPGRLDRAYVMLSDSVDDSDRHTNINPDCNGYSHTKPNGNNYEDAVTNAFAVSDCQSDGERHTEPDCQPNRNPVIDSDFECHTDAVPVFDIESNAVLLYDANQFSDRDSERYTDAKPVVFTVAVANSICD